MEDTQSNRSDDLGDISDSRLILSKAKLVLAAIRHETFPAHIRDHAVQLPKMVTTPNLAAVPAAYGVKVGSRSTSALTYYLRRETVIPSDQPGSDHHGGMARWRKALFAAMLLNVNRPAAYYGLPAAQVVEIGLEVEI